MTARIGIAVAALASMAALSACGGPDDATAGVVTQAAVEAVEPAGPEGAVIEVRMITDEQGNYFEPSTIAAEQGDVIRFVLVSGVHNVSLPPDRNPAGLTLPPPGEMLQLPGQAYDLKVDMPPGEYYFQCDPHAALGMTGTLTVSGR